MFRYILKRVINCFIVILISITAVFFAIRMVPSNVVDTKLPVEQQEIIKEELGLNRPVTEQYVDYMKDVMRLDLGDSLKIQKNTPVTKLITNKAAVSIPIGATAVFFASIVGLGIGIMAAVKRGKTVDHVATFITVLGISIPSVVIAILLQYFSTSIGLPTIYRAGNPMSLVAPIIALSFWPIALISKYIRTELIDVLNSEYILLAEAKGVSRNTLLFKHALRNAVIPAITVVGPLFVSTIIGSLVVEKIFAIPGLGGLMSQAISLTDYPVIQGLTLLFATLFTFTYLVIDIIYVLVDPRIRLSGGSK